jgi:hypothetical protein
MRTDTIPEGVCKLLKGLVAHVDNLRNLLLTPTTEMLNFTAAANAISRFDLGDHESCSIQDLHPTRNLFTVV